MKQICIKTFWISLSALFILLSGCIKDKATEYPNKEETPVRILTSISFGMGNTGTRATGTDEKYEEGKDDGTEAERAVKNLRVMAFDVSGGIQRHNKLYSPSEFKTKTENGATLYYVDMKILSGYYRFVLFANENSAWTASLNAVTNYSDLAGIGTGFNNNLLRVEDVEANGIPLIGEQFLNIPANPAATITNPQEMHPIVELKRTIAKAEINLTNQVAGTVNNNAKNYQLKAIYVEKLNKPYNVFEQATAPITEAYISEAATGADPTTYRAITHTSGEAYNGSFTYYMAERKSVADDANATAIVIVAHKEGDAEDTKYRIPLYQTTNHALGGTKDYKIFRNTLYQLNCVLHGTEMNFIEVFYTVGDWQSVTYSLFMGYGYNVDINGDNVTISNTVEACKPHEVKLVALNGAKFSDDTTEKIFGSQTAETHIDYAATAKTNYTLKDVPLSGDYLAVYYNGALVKTFKK